MRRIHIFVHFTEHPDIFIADAEQCDKFLSEAINMLDRSDCEIGSILYCDFSNVEQFIDNIQAIENLIGFTGTYSLAEVFLSLTSEITAIYWDSNPMHDIEEVSLFYKHFDSESRSVVEPCQSLFKEISERSFRFAGSVIDRCAILDVGITLNNKSFITTIRGDRLQEPVLKNFQVLSSFVKLENWLYENAQVKAYNFDDNRHCEDSKQYIPGKSPIIGGQAGKNHVAGFLLRAIGDKKVRDFLVNFDEKNNQYIRFEWEFENPQNRYHGYHLIKPGSHERDEVAISKLSPRIIQLLNFRKSLSEK